MLKSQYRETHSNDILIVDDEIANLQLLSEMLRKEDYQVRPANRPQLAIDSALAQPPKLILLDVRMPGMDGFEVCRRLKQDNRTRDIPIIFVSALQDTQDKAKGFEAGGVDFISKPFEKMEVLARVRTHLNLRTMQLSMEEQVRKRTSEVIESEERFRATFEQAAVGIAHVAPDGWFLRVNQKFCDIVGFSQEEMMSKSFQDITHPDDLDIDLECVQQLLEGEKANYSMEKRYYRKDDTIVWVNLTVSLLRDNERNPRYFVAVVNDISERKQAEEALLESHDFLTHLTSAVPDAILSIKMPDRTINWGNDSFNVLGYEPEEYVGQSTEKYYANPDDYYVVGRLQQDAIRKGEDFIRTEVMARRKDGRAIPVELTATFYREKGELAQITALVRDISDRKRAEEALRQSHDFLKHLTTSVPDAIFSVKLPERTIGWANDSYHVLGYAPEELVGQRTEKFYASPEEAQKLGALLANAVGAGEDMLRTESLLRRRDGEIFPAEINVSIYREHGEVVSATGLIRDITERRVAEQKLLDYQKRLKSLTSQLTLAEEQERRRIAADLHDDVSQTLAITRLQLAAAIQDSEDARLREQLHEISQRLLEAIRDTRQLIFELSSPAMHELGLGGAIAEWADENLKKVGEIEFSLVDNLSGNELDEEQRIILFRNLRELLTNTIKHAGATKVNVVLETVDNDLRITVRDDGTGFDPERALNQFDVEGGFGIFSIQERMEGLGGKLEIHSAPQHGCTAVLSVPCSEQTGSSA